MLFAAFYQSVNQLCNSILNCKITNNNPFRQTGFILILQEKFSKQIDEEPITITSNPLDKVFVEKVINIIETNMENGEINVSVLCYKMAISRTILFSKMKGITGQTAHDFIQSIRLKLAAKMIREFPAAKQIIYLRQLSIGVPLHYSSEPICVYQL